MNATEYEQYRKLKKLRLEAADKFAFINLLTFRLLVLLDLTDSDIYDFDSLLGNVRLTVEDLYNYCLDYSDMLENYVRRD